MSTKRGAHSLPISLLSIAKSRTSNFELHFEVHGYCRACLSASPCSRRICEALSAPPVRPVLAVRRSPVRRGGTDSSPRACVAVSVRRGVARILPGLAVDIGAARSVIAIRIATVGNVLDHGSELLLQNLDALLDDGVGLEVADALDLEIEALGHGVVVKRLALLRRLLPLGVFALGPEMGSV
jgi:hypothetical protein